MAVETSLQSLQQGIELLTGTELPAEQLQLWEQAQLHETVTPAIAPSTGLRPGPDESIPVPAEAQR